MSVSRPFQSTHHFVSPPIVGYVATPDAEEDPSISRGVLAPEFKGRVKLLLQRIVEDNQPHLVLRNRIVHDELYPRWMKYASFRENKLKAQVALLHASDERAFSTRPEGYCELAQHDRKFRKIEILECRLVPAIARCINWSEGNTETCVDLAVLTLDTLDGVHFAQLYRSLCTFSAHALGRFYQRAFSNSDEAAIDSDVVGSAGGEGAAGERRIVVRLRVRGWWRLARLCRCAARHEAPQQLQGDVGQVVLLVTEPGRLSLQHRNADTKTARGFPGPFAYAAS